MRILRPLLVVAVAAAITACGGGGTSSTSSSSSSSSPSVSTAPAVTAVEARPDPATMEPVQGVVATATADLAVYDAIDGRITSTLSANTEFGSPTTVHVVAWAGADGAWLDVQLPVRPNGARGFVRAAEVRLARVDGRLDVDLATRTLRWYSENALVLETAIAIGSAQNPTPTGDFFVTDVLDTGDESSAYGPYALGLSAHSETLSEFGGGDGQVGIHGTDQPSSIGNAVSHGCVRVPNEIVRQLARSLPLGTPVSIH